MGINSGNALQREISIRAERVRSYLRSREYSERFLPEHICDSVYSYINLGGKSLRPVALLWACGAAGGSEDEAIPAAAAIEAYHTWTLIHDDVIDKDAKRRGGATVHEEFRQRAVKELSYDEASARHYGLSIAILAGDILQGWSTALLSELSTKGNVDPDVTIFLIQELALRVQGTLVEGETLDIQYSRYPLDLLNEDLIVRMLWKKTGALYEFAGMAGALIGLGLPSPTHKLVRAISAFAGKCGIAFQLQDDILGIVGQEELLGKPIGSDIREGKRTVIMYHALKRANDRQRAALLEVLGNEHALENDVRDVQGLLRQLGAIEYTKKLARSYVEEATQHLDSVPVSQYTDLLYAWADLMIERDF